MKKIIMLLISVFICQEISTMQEPFRYKMVIGNNQQGKVLITFVGKTKQPKKYELHVIEPQNKTAELNISDGINFDTYLGTYAVRVAINTRTVQIYFYPWDPKKASSIVAETPLTERTILVVRDNGAVVRL